MRATLVFFVLLSFTFVGRAETRPPQDVLVIASLSVEAHRVAAAGIQSVLAPMANGLRLIDASQANGDVTLGVGVIIALGSEAARIAESQRGRIPAVYTMVLHRNPEWEIPGQPGPVTIPSGRLGG